jgi:hypothetical protein
MEIHPRELSNLAASNAWDLVAARDNFLPKEESPSSVIALEVHLQREELHRQVDVDESPQRCLEGKTPGSTLGKVPCKVDNTFLSHVNSSSFDFLSGKLNLSEFKFLREELCFEYVAWSVSATESRSEGVLGTLWTMTLRVLKRWS